MRFLVLSLGAFVAAIAAVVSLQKFNEAGKSTEPTEVASVPENQKGVRSLSEGDRLSTFDSDSSAIPPPDSSMAVEASIVPSPSAISETPTESTVEFHSPLRRAREILAEHSYASLLELAEAGDIAAMEMLATILHECAGEIREEGVSTVCSDVPLVNQELLEKYWEPAAMEGSVEAQRKLANLYEPGSEKNVYWLRMAANEGDEPAQVSLARSLLNAEDQDAQLEALYWLGVAERGGSVAARDLRRRLEPTLGTDQLRRAQDIAEKM